jgi:hypothetical protein
MNGNEEADLIREAEQENRERAEKIANSHLLSTSCVNCSAPTLAVAERVREARCGECIRARHGAGGVYKGSYGPVVGYPLGRAPEREPVHDPYPGPESVGQWIRDPDGRLRFADLPAPVSVTDLIGFARNAGWPDVRIRYSRGRPSHSTTGKPTAMSHLIAVRLSGNGPNHAVAVYVKPVTGGAWAWKTVWLFGPDLKPFGECGVTELKDWLARGGNVGPEWYEEIVARHAEADARKKQKLACDAGRHADVAKVGDMSVCRLCEHTWDDGEQPWRKPKKAKEHA